MIRPQDNSLLCQMDDDLLDALSEQQQQELAGILEDYLADLESGKGVDRESILRSHPELASALTRYLGSIEALYQAGVAVNDSSAAVASTLDNGLGNSSQLGDYIIRHEIGRGGMGIVYAADQISLGRTVALKTLPFAAVMDQKQVARFKNEAQAAAGLHHPNIVPVYGVGCERGVHYFSMQMIEGQSLEQAIHQLRDGGQAKQTASPSTTTDNHFSTQKSIRSREFSRSVARIGQQAAEAVHYAHENGIVHRDVKPSNLLLDAAGKLWITDFGLARVSNTSNLTVSGDMIGTARYMSPEQAAGRMHEVDHRSDIYSLGITLYELLTLHPAFDAATRQELLRAVECDSPVSPRRLNPSIPTDLETIVLKAIEKNRDDRYASAGELAEDLGHFLGGRPTLAKRPRLQDQAFRLAIRHRKAVTAGAAAVMLTLLLVSVSAVMIHTEQRRTEVEAQRAALHLRETQRVVDNFGALVDQRLEHLPGSSSLRAELLGELEKYYSAFLIQAGDDPSFAIDLATTQFRLAAVHQRLGDFQRASDGYRKSLAGFQQLASQAPGDLDRMADIALCRNNLGQVASKLGDHERARADYEAAIRIYSNLADAGNAKGQSGLARTQMNLGLLMSAHRDPDASRLLGAALESLQVLSSESPDDLSLLDQLALCENNLASVVLATDPERAESLLRNAKKRYERLTSERPGSPEHRSDEALTLGNLAAVVAHQGDYELASSLYQDVVRVRKILIDIEPGVISHSYDLAIAHQQLGAMLASASRLKEAASAYDDATQLLSRLLEINPRDHRTRSNLGRMLSNLGTIENRLGNSDRGLDLFQQAEQQQQIAVELSPENHGYQELLNQHQEQISKMKWQSSEPAGEKSVKTAGT